MAHQESAAMYDQCQQQSCYIGKDAWLYPIARRVVPHINPKVLSPNVITTITNIQHVGQKDSSRRSGAACPAVNSATLVHRLFGRVRRTRVRDRV